MELLKEVTYWLKKEKQVKKLSNLFGHQNTSYLIFLFVTESFDSKLLHSHIGETVSHLRKQWQFFLGGMQMKPIHSFASELIH